MAGEFGTDYVPSVASDSVPFSGAYRSYLLTRSERKPTVQRWVWATMQRDVSVTSMFSSADATKCVWPAFTGISAPGRIRGRTVDAELVGILHIARALAARTQTSASSSRFRRAFFVISGTSGSSLNSRRRPSRHRSAVSVSGLGALDCLKKNAIPSARQASLIG